MKLLSACDIDCLLLHEFFNNILSHYIEKKIKLFFKLIEMDNSCSFPLFPSARQSICIYMWVSLVLDRPRQGETWVKDSDPSVNNTSFCEDLIHSGTTQWQNFFLAPISLSQGEKHTILLFMLCGCSQYWQWEKWRIHKRRLKIKHVCLCVSVCVCVYTCIHLCSYM